MEKLINCKHCGQSIAKSAKVCPYCGGKNKKPVFKQAWFWLLIVLVLIAAISGGNKEEGKNKDSSKVGEVSTAADKTQAETKEKATKSETKTAEQTTQAPEPTQPKETQPPKKDIYSVGDTAMDGKKKMVYMASGVFTDYSRYSEPAPGKQYIFFTFYCENTGSSSDCSVSYLDFKCYADGYAADAYYGTDTELSATLSAGRGTVGSVYFTVPADAKRIELEYETNFLTEEKIKFLYEAGKDAGFTVPKNTERTPDAYKAGDIIEAGDLKITFLSVSDYTSDNMFIQPAKGYHFISCELEFENTGKSDRSVSSFSFDCYADGLDCGQTFSRDDDLSATISPGRKVKGTVTFEVPDDASVIEVEYETNIWTSSRVVFTAK